MKQQFKVYDLVHINKEMPDTMAHFPKDKDAIILKYSHNPAQLGNDWEHSYEIYIKDHGSVSWYHDSNLTLIKHDKEDLLETWKKEKHAEDTLHSDLNWIFENGPEVLKNPSGVSIQTLASCLGVDNLWGNNGEGYVYYQNAMAVILMSEKFLKSKDKTGWLEFCKLAKQKVS